MTSEIQKLQEKIKSLKRKEEKESPSSGAQGYNMAMVILTDLLSCVFVGLGIGLFFQKFFHTSVLWTAGLTFLGGIAGLYGVIRFAINQDKK